MAGGLERPKAKEKASSQIVFFSFDNLDSNTNFLRIKKKGALAIASCWAQPLIQGATLMLEAAFSSGLASWRREGAAAHLVSSCWRERNSMSWTKSRIAFGMLQEMCISFYLFIENSLQNQGN